MKNIEKCLVSKVIKLLCLKNLRKILDCFKLFKGHIQKKFKYFNKFH